MTFVPRRPGLAAAAALAAALAGSCARDRVRREDTFVAARTLGESTASPGDDPARPVARPLDTQEVSATISRPPASPPPGPTATEPAAPAAPSPDQSTTPPEPPPPGL